MQKINPLPIPAPKSSHPVFWFYGLSGAGKTSITRGVANELRALGTQILVLDGDEIRSGLNRDLGFSTADRRENIRRAAEIAALASSQGTVVIAAFITPEKGMRALAREIVEPFPFYEIFLNCNFSTCRLRDPKGLYKNAADGLVKNFTGSDAVFDWPDLADLMLDTQNQTLDNSIKVALEFISSKKQPSPITLTHHEIETT